MTTLRPSSDDIQDFFFLCIILMRGFFYYNYKKWWETKQFFYFGQFLSFHSVLRVTNAVWFILMSSSTNKWLCYRFVCSIEKTFMLNTTYSGMYVMQGQLDEGNWSFVSYKWRTTYFSITTLFFLYSANTSFLSNEMILRMSNPTTTSPFMVCDL